MRSSLLVPTVGLLLAACGSPTGSSSAIGSASSTLTQPEQRFITAITAAIPGAPGRWGNATLIRHGYAACTALNADADNPEAAVAAVGSDVDDHTARVIVRVAADELCPAASAVGLSPAAPSTLTAQPDETGRPFASGGITLTVKEAWTTDTIEMNEATSALGPAMSGTPRPSPAATRSSWSSRPTSSATRRPASI